VNPSSSIFSINDSRTPQIIGFPRHQSFGFGGERRSSGKILQFGRWLAEYVIRPGLWRRLSRRVNITARRNPVKPPSTPSVMERLLNVRRPWPVSRKPVYAIVDVHKIARTFMAPHISAEFTIRGDNLQAFNFVAG
jgi:hypothetical protein